MFARRAAPFLVIAAIFAAAGCGGDDDESDSPQPADTPNEQATGPPRTRDESREAKPRGRIDPRSVTRRPTRTCRAVSVPGEAGTMVPPVPAVRARRHGNRVVVSYRFRRLPQACRPKYLRVNVNSVDKLTNISSVFVRRVRAAGQVSVPVPEHGPAPYEARVSAVSDPPLGSPATTVPVD
jgi:hypothetical protein